MRLAAAPECEGTGIDPEQALIVARQLVDGQVEVLGQVRSKASSQCVFADLWLLLLLRLGYWLASGRIDLGVLDLRSCLLLLRRCLLLLHWTQLL